MDQLTIKKMKYIKSTTTYSNIYYTPSDLSCAITAHFKPSGKLLDPYYGNGSFYNELIKYSTDCDWTELEMGKDFFAYSEKVDWIISNPPFSNGFREHLKHALEIASNIAFLITLNHFTTSARLKLIDEYGLYMREIIYVPTPKTFPQSGFQLAVVYLNKIKGDCKIQHLTIINK